MKLHQPLIGLFSLTVLLSSCGNNTPGNPSNDAVAKDSTQTDSAKKRIVILDPEALQLIDSTAAIETIASGFKWTEGPLYINDGDYLLFSDIPNNRICKWKEGEGAGTYLTPTGNTGDRKVEREPGSNGLLLDAKGNLVLCQHGDRRIARMNATLKAPKAEFITLAGAYDGKRLNSPNDAVFSSNGDLYFTDPPYGFDKLLEDTAKQLGFQGVYRLKPNGKLDLVTKEVKFPNGIVISPDRKYLYVANSDPDNKVWMKFELGADGLVKGKSIFYEAKEDNGKQNGNPDGMKLNAKGYLFAAGPEGLWIFNPAGKVIARIYTGQSTSNCAFTKDEKTLFLTCDDYLMRVKLK